MSIKIKKKIEQLRRDGLYRRLPRVESNIEDRVKSGIEGSVENDVLEFSSNDYLGLSRNEESIVAGYRVALEYGSGSTGSRLLSGNKGVFEDFEKRIAIDKGMEDCLIFNSGFIANFSIISAFCLLDSLFIFDKLNHASMYVGLSGGAKLKRFKHLDYDELEGILRESDCDTKVIASETVFGMDGDIADIGRLIDLSDRYNAYLVLDEAHATGLLGRDGYGLSTNYDLDKSRTIIMGTFSKALASTGAYIACSREIKEYLIQVSKGFIYSTAISPFCIGVARYNWELLPRLSDLRERVLGLAKYFRERLGFGNGYMTNIIPVIFSNQEDMLEARDSLFRIGINVSAIRRPTSPTPRLRFAVNANHDRDAVDRVLDFFAKKILQI